MSATPTKNPLIQSIRSWIDRTFADPGATGLFFTIIIFLLLVEFFGHILTPVLMSVAIAYMLSGVIEFLIKKGCPKGLAIGVVYTLFLALIVWLIAGLLPMLIKQLTNMVNELPQAFIKLKIWMQHLSQTYPKIMGPSFVNNVVAYMQSQLITFGKTLLSYSYSSLGGLITVIMYVLLVPLMVFFFLKDKVSLLHTMSDILPKNKTVLVKVSNEINHKIASYIRGRVIEIIIVTIVSIITFLFCGLQYAVLLGVITGLSVIIPYVGAVLAAVPIIIVSLLQFGFSWPFWIVFIAYWIIIAIDGNLLMPILFAGVMDLSATAIIISVLVFGDIWGFWGIFLSIPLASVVKVIWTTWPRESQ